MKSRALFLDILLPSVDLDMCYHVSVLSPKIHRGVASIHKPHRGWSSVLDGSGGEGAVVGRFLTWRVRVCPRRDVVCCFGVEEQLNDQQR
jgi:hypothetical protein